MDQIDHDLSSIMQIDAKLRINEIEIEFAFEGEIECRLKFIVSIGIDRLFGGTTICNAIYNIYHWNLQFFCFFSCLHSLNFQWNGDGDGAGHSRYKRKR